MEIIKWLGQVNNEIYMSLNVGWRYDLELLAYRQYGEKIKVPDHIKSSGRGKVI